MRAATERAGITAGACLLLILIHGTAVAGPDNCVLVGGVVTCTGDQSQGIASGVDFPSPPATTINVYGLSGPIRPDSPGKEGIYFVNGTGSSVTVVSGNSGDRFAITTQGDAAAGIQAISQGAPASYAYRASLDLYVPAGAGGGGGPVGIESYSDITTNGNSSHGMFLQNQIGGYPWGVIQKLESFLIGNIALSLESVAGSAGNIDNAVGGSAGGTFTLRPDGTFDFALGASFDNLAIGANAVTEVGYRIRQSSGGGTDSSSGVLRVTVTRNDVGELEWWASNHFAEYPGYDLYGKISETTPLWPDLQGWVDGLKADAGISGAGESLSVTNAGSIATGGPSSHGILAQTTSGSGSTGRNGGGFWSFGTKEPTAGGTGANGGSITVTHDGSIHTDNLASGGIVALSRGGTGGKGGGRRNLLLGQIGREGRRRRRYHGRRQR